MPRHLIEEIRYIVYLETVSGLKLASVTHTKLYPIKGISNSKEVVWHLEHLHTPCSFSSYMLGR